jgi:protein O-GlcNAcase / histone acetyltransferase
MTTTFLSGVIEGFYGQPWTEAERFELFELMAAWELNTYFYAPKDDLHHRARWREPYASSEAERLERLIQSCRTHDLRFIYGLSPGLDIRYGHEAELASLHRRVDQMLALGCEHFALLFDDIPDRLEPADLERWGTLAPAQCHVANALFAWTRERRPAARFLFCPTAYCGRMAAAKLGGEGYLEALGRELLPEIDIFWTGPEIVSREITVAHVREVRAVLQRKPLIWDNLHANDYDGRRFFCGPYSGRPPELRDEVSGVLSNPNNEFALNYVPLRTLAEFVRRTGTWDARNAYLAAMRDWLPSFATAGQPFALEDLVLLGDCYYLPYEEGPAAMALYERARGMLARHPAAWGDDAPEFLAQAGRLRAVCARLAELRHRPLFHALSRRIWELREELDLLDRYVASKSTAGNHDIPVTSDFHLPGTYRGGMVARLQRLLVQQPDGTFTPAAGPGGVSASRDARLDDDSSKAGNGDGCSK